MSAVQSHLGWTAEALVEGSRDAGLSPAFVGAFSRGESELVEVSAGAANSYHYGAWGPYSSLLAPPVLHGRL